jgi:type VI protein secretion system component VasF
MSGKYTTSVYLGLERGYKLFNAENLSIMDDIGKNTPYPGRAFPGLSTHGSRTDNQKFRYVALYFPVWLTALISLAGVFGAYLFLQYLNVTEVAGIMDLLDTMTFK